jgi:hypothetical protein
MRTQQPEWKLIAQLGDANPLDYGGYFIYEDTTGVYAPEGELLISPDSDEDGQWTVYRFSIDRCTLENGILSDNRFHPDSAAWFAKPESEKANRPQDTTYLSNVADFCGMPLEEMQRLFISDSPVERAHGYRAVGEYHGFDNLDQYPLTFKSREEVEARYAGELRVK